LTFDILLCSAEILGKPVILSDRNGFLPTRLAAKDLV
jgi:hypothetical protein